MSHRLPLKSVGESDTSRYPTNKKCAANPTSGTHCLMPVILLFLELIWSSDRGMTHRQNQEPQQLSLVDGVAVKISERYKPPPRIGLAVGYSQRLSMNKQLQDGVPSYDFVLEKTVKEQLEALKRVKSEAAENCKLRAKRIEGERKEREERKKNYFKEKETVSEMVNESSLSSSGNGILQPMQVILKPIPLSGSTSKISNSVADRSPFNISDFEADTSSPFDNMELKTLNDMEELAQVLQSEKPVTTTNMPTYPTYSPGQSSYYNSYLSSKNEQIGTYIPTYQQPLYNGTSEYAAGQRYSYPNQSVYNTTSYSTVKTVPEILKTLETKLENQHISNVKFTHSIKMQDVKAKDELEDPFPSLPQNLQDLASMISSMGFPLPRVARACKLLGDDHKKVVEYLLAMSELMDLGFPEKDVSSALQQCDNDRDKALDKLIL